VPQESPTFVDVASAFTDLLCEVCPNLPPSVAASMVVERLDEVADHLLDLEWDRQRQSLYPSALRLAHNKHVGRSYAERRGLELVDAQRPAGGSRRTTPPAGVA
jgi:hypothetical protein